MIKKALASAGAWMMLAAAVPATAATASVSMREGGSPNFFYFTPVRLTVGVGDIVTWRNNTSADHTVTAYKDGDDRPFDSSDNVPDEAGQCDQGPLGPANDCIKPGESFSVTFDEPGVFSYYCKPHGTTANETIRPRPSIGGQAQPCGMCGIVEVRAPKSPTSRPRSSPPPRTGGTSTRSASPSPTPTATASVDPGATPTADGSGLAAPGGEDDDPGKGGRTALALLAIVALSGAGYATWRKFFVTG